MSDRIRIVGARENNLRNIDVDIPRDSLVVVTGLSGSGKSSLAFDTIYAEGQRRYVESLSAYARQFLDQMKKPEVDSVEGLSPAISIEQKTTSRNPRSTVGTTTEVYDFLRLLYATIGRPHCYRCGREIRSQSVAEIVERLKELPAKSKVEILAPVVRGRKGEYKKELVGFRKRGFTRARIDGETVELDGSIQLERHANHTIEVVVDRLIMRAGIDKRLTDSVETALRMADHTMTAVIRGGGRNSKIQERTFSRRFACPDCGVSYSEITPRMFSFNSPQGACPECNGIGRSRSFDPVLMVVDAEAKVGAGAIGPWNKRLSLKYGRAIAAVCQAYGASASDPYGRLPEAARQAILYGMTEERRRRFDSETAARLRTGKRFAGMIPILTKRYRESESDWVRGELERYMQEKTCESCGGSRLRKEARSILVGNTPIDEIASLSVTSAMAFFGSLRLSRRERLVAKLVLKEIVERLDFMVGVGLGYLSLSRPTATLSGGEGQRIRLATQIGAGLSGVLYVLDEPSIGLHPRDHARLLASLRKLTESGNTVLVVEHDADTILQADHVIDMGPGAGRHGGLVIAAGTPQEVEQNPSSLTGRFLAGRERIDVPAERRPGSGEQLTVQGARCHNLKNITASFPLGKMTCVTGVSGSGKSSLVVDTLYAALARELHKAEGEVGDCDGLEGLEFVDKVIDINQAPIGRTPRSNPATYTGVFSDIRELYAMLPESRMRGYTAGRFSFNVKGGRCESCHGDGSQRVEMHFLPDIYVTCDLCGGRRYNRETLQVRYKGKTIADVLDMTIGEAATFLSPIPSAVRKLETLVSVGLDYLHLGQPATTLSGGEAQRIKLAKELAKRATGKTVYILDEPTTGLHFADVRRLLEVLGRLVDAGNTVIIIEHHMDVIKTADHVIDLGPEGGEQGGFIVATGSPEELARERGSHTAGYLLAALRATRAA